MAFLRWLITRLSNNSAALAPLFSAHSDVAAAPAAVCPGLVLDYNAHRSFAVRRADPAADHSYRHLYASPICLVAALPTRTSSLHGFDKNHHLKLCCC